MLRATPISIVRNMLSGVAILTFVIGNTVVRNMSQTLYLQHSQIILQLAINRRWFFGIFMMWLGVSFLLCLILFVIISHSLITAIRETTAFEPNERLSK